MYPCATNHYPDGATNIGFIAWNQFQANMFSPIAKTFQHPILLVLKDRKHADQNLISSPRPDFVTLPVSSSDLANLDGTLDLILTQTSFPKIGTFEHTKIVSLQYSLTKERHQLGPWHFHCDANLAYGPYSAKKLSLYGPVFDIGNPRLDAAINQDLDNDSLFTLRDRLCAQKPTILYCPTWGKLSSINLFMSHISSIANDFNVIVSLHHNTILREKSSLPKNVNLDPLLPVDDPMLYYLISSDIVVTDYSGTMFDAIALDKPVILFRPSDDPIGVENLTEESIEIRQSQMIGPIVRDSAALKDTIYQMLDGSLDSFRSKNNVIREMCFTNLGCAVPAAIKALNEIVQLDVKQNEMQRWTSRHIRLLERRKKK